MIHIIVCFIISTSSVVDLKPNPDDLSCEFDVDCGRGDCWVGVCEEGICYAYRTCV